MATVYELDEVREFINRYRNADLLSTGAELVDYIGDLYNITGSTQDPRTVDGSKGVSWKKLFDKYADFSEARCYVTSPSPAEVTTHPEFSVGGHMTPNSSGLVKLGEVAYLMPLCKWHNSTARNGIAFKHTKTKMLKLTGFMEGDSAITFAARLTSDAERILLLLNHNTNEWTYREMSSSEKQPAQNKLNLKMSNQIKNQDYAIFKKRGTSFIIEQSSIENNHDALADLTLHSSGSPAATR